MSKTARRKQTTAQIQQQLGTGGALITGRIPHPFPRPCMPITPDISFVTYGMPTSQGSHKIARGRVVDQSEELGPWRDAIRLQVQRAIRLLGKEWGGVIREPVFVQATFTFPHTAASRKRGDVLYSNTPDTDKLQRALGDAISPKPVSPSVGKNLPPNHRKQVREKARKEAERMCILSDDSQIVLWDAFKVYEGMTVDALPAPGVTVEVWRISRITEYAQQALGSDTPFSVASQALVATPEVVD